MCGHGVGLGVAVEGGLGLFGEDAFGAPVLQVLGGAGVAVVRLLAGGKELLRLGVAGLVLAQDDADEVVGAALVVALLHLGRDLVVGLGDDVLHADAGGVVAEGAEGIDAGHARSQFSSGCLVRLYGELLCIRVTAGSVRHVGVKLAGRALVVVMGKDLAEAGVAEEPRQQVVVPVFENLAVDRGS